MNKIQHQPERVRPDFFYSESKKTQKKSARRCFLYVKENHLGNVVVTVSDARQVLNSGASVTGYMAIVKSASDYSSFGVTKAGRTSASTSYRYSFNGKEKEKEIASGDLDFGARIYDARLGRWLSVDAMEAKHADVSTYSYCGNNPVLYVDHDGNDFIIYMYDAVTYQSVPVLYVISNVVSAPEGGVAEYCIPLPAELYPQYAVFGEMNTIEMNLESPQIVPPVVTISMGINATIGVGVVADLELSLFTAGPYAGRMFVYESHSGLGENYGIEVGVGPSVSGTWYFPDPNNPETNNAAPYLTPYALEEGSGKFASVGAGPIGVGYSVTQWDGSCDPLTVSPPKYVELSFGCGMGVAGIDVGATMGCENNSLITEAFSCTPVVITAPSYEDNPNFCGPKQEDSIPVPVPQEPQSQPNAIGPQQ